MRRIGIFLGVAAVVAATVALTAGTALAQAQTEMVDNVRVPVTIVDVNPCTGERFLVEGTAHFILHITEDPNGRFHVKAHSDHQLEGVSDSGARYLVRSAANDITFVSESSSDNTFTQNFKILSQGSPTPEDDFLVRIRFHITTNANGEVTSEFAVVEAECR